MAASRYGSFSISSGKGPCFAVNCFAVNELARTEWARQACDSAADQSDRAHVDVLPFGARQSSRTMEPTASREARRA